MGCFHDIFPHSLNFPTESFIVPTADLSAFRGFHNTLFHLLTSINCEHVQCIISY